MSGAELRRAVGLSALVAVLAVGVILRVAEPATEDRPLCRAWSAAAAAWAAAWETEAAVSARSAWMRDRLQLSAPETRLRWRWARDSADRYCGLTVRRAAP